jgi:2-polyprenyl-3-methyl-5-hydroxy-6-metoxy-1,4-benzoquinol methylase
MAENEQIDEGQWRKTFEETPLKGLPDHSTILCTRHSVERLMLMYQRIVDERGLRGGCVIDVGCGLGEYSRHMGARGADVVSVDRSKNMLRAAKGRDQSGRLLPAQADACGLPFRDACADAILCIEVLQLVNREDAVMSEVVRVLKPSGTVILSTLNRIKPREFIMSLATRLLGRNVGGVSSFRRYNPFEMRRKMLLGGFEDVQLRPVITLPKSLLFVERMVYSPHAIRIIERLPIFLIFASSFYVIARKR